MDEIGALSHYHIPNLRNNVVNAAQQEKTELIFRSWGKKGAAFAH